MKICVCFIESLRLEKSCKIESVSLHSCSPHKKKPLHKQVLFEGDFSLSLNISFKYCREISVLELCAFSINE